MTIGLILLAMAAILIFFGVTETLFRKMGIKNWVAFLLVMALVIGAIVPKINIGNVFSVNVGGFLVPLVIIAALFFVMRQRGDVFRAIIAMLTVAAVAVGVRMLIQPLSTGLILASSLIVGFVGGTAAFLTGQTRISTLAAAIGGIILGDIIINFFYVFFYKGYAFSLGSLGVFDSITIAAVFGLVLTQSVGAIKRVMSQKRVARTALSIEAAEDVDISKQGNQDNEKKQTQKITPDYDGFFDDFI